MTKQHLPVHRLPVCLEMAANNVPVRKQTPCFQSVASPDMVYAAGGTLRNPFDSFILSLSVMLNTLAGKALSFDPPAVQTE